MINQETFEQVFKSNLKIENYSKSIDSLFSPRMKNKINYKPYYQRNYVWDNSKATYFIESILLGTEIPPLVFFDNNSSIEIIDGRQRFETIIRFLEGKFSLKVKGLQVLTDLKNKYYTDLDDDIVQKFLDTKIRIIEFKLLDQINLNQHLEDRIKKEIFFRYNSGITPLKKAEIDNAIYDSDTVSLAFKNLFSKYPEKSKLVFDTFFHRKNKDEETPSEIIMSFIRRSLILPMTPIVYYARGTGRTDLLTKLYDKFSNDNIDNENNIIINFFKKVDYINIIKNISIDRNLKCNRLALECFLWGLGILEMEDIDIQYNNELANSIAEYIDSNIDKYKETDYGFNKEVIERYYTTAQYFEKEGYIKASIYISPSDIKKAELKDLNVSNNENKVKLGQLESLRLNKPEPSRISIDDVVRLMNKKRFLIRPSYQRKEVINPTKASAIIESILLGIALPAIFIYKREDGILEVIDGQQRLLTLLGFIDSTYLDEEGKIANSKNRLFSLKKMKILKELEGLKFNQLTNTLQDKIFDFPLYLVEIEQNSNPNFNPIDLFIRLNDKPYPIRENSFEMWNSWVNIEIIDDIKPIRKTYDKWFFIKNINNYNDVDRMENEELITCLAYLDYHYYYNEKDILDVYQKTNRLNARIGSKSLITNLLITLNEEDNQTKLQNFKSSIKNIDSFIRKVKYILLDTNIDKPELNKYLLDELNTLFNLGTNNRYCRRTIQDFYFLWYILNSINLEMVKFHRIEMKEDIKKIFIYIKNIPEQDILKNNAVEQFKYLCHSFKNKYSTNQRKTILTDEQKKDLLLKQNNTCPISNTPIFIGDEIEVDHHKPISIGGLDEIDNLRIVHKDDNRKKGAKFE